MQLLTGVRIHQLSLCSRQRRTPREPLDRLIDPPLLQAELGQRGDRDVAVWVDVQRFFAECLSLTDFLLPLEEGQGLVHKGEDIARTPKQISVARWNRECNRLVLVKLEGLVESLNALLELLLVQQQLTAIEVLENPPSSFCKNALVVVRFPSIRELLEDPPESRHARTDTALLVLRDGFLDMGEDEGSVECSRLLVVGDRLVELLHDEID